MRKKHNILFAQTVNLGIVVILRFRAYVKSSTGLTNGVISVAFDDGLKSQFDYAFPLMKARKIKGTFYVTTNKIRDCSYDSSYMNIFELQTLQANGNEIGSHSNTHSRFTSLSDRQIHDECRSSKEILLSHGFAADNFAYPYGDSSKHVNSIVCQYYRTARSAYKKPYRMYLSSSQFELIGFAGETGDSNVSIILQYITNMVALTNSYAIVFFHNVIPNKNTCRFTVSSQDFTSFLDYGVSTGIKFLTVNRALDFFTLPHYALQSNSN